LAAPRLNLPLDRSILKRYTMGALSPVAASLLTWAIEPWFGGKAPMIFFTLASILAAAYGGRGPGLVATGLSAGLVSLLFNPQLLVMSFAHGSVIVLVVLGVGISLTMGRLQAINTRLARSTEHLEILNERLTARTEDLSQANEELQRFAYALAHDLSTPLRGISALTDLLVQRNQDRLDDSSKECAEMIVTRVQRTLAMIKGLLDYAAAVEKPEDRAPVDCNAVVAQAMTDLADAIKDSGAQIHVDPLPSVPGAASHLEQVFSNLISNAIKYRPSVRMPVIHISAAEKGGEWVFCVSDNGIGIDMKYAEEIFGMFRRLHSDDQYEGSGIGLALCKIIVQRHGGRIWLESEIGKGCRFYVALPKGNDGIASGVREQAVSRSSG
jgi:signal transduction histidine kinase